MRYELISRRFELRAKSLNLFGRSSQLCGTGRISAEIGVRCQKFDRQVLIAACIDSRVSEFADLHNYILTKHPSQITKEKRR